MVHQPVRHQLRRVQRGAARPPRRRPRSRSAPRGRRRRPRPARVAAHPVPHDRRRTGPGDRSDRGRRTGPGAGVGGRTGRRGTGRRVRRTRVRRHGRPAGAVAAAARGPADPRTGDRRAPHLRRRVLAGTARAGRDERLHRPHRGPGPALDTARGAVRGLRTVAAEGAGRHRRSGQRAVQATRILGAHPRRTAGGPRSAHRPAAAVGTYAPRRGPRVPARTRRAPSAHRRRPHPQRDRVHGGTRGAGSPAGPTGRHRRRRDRHTDRGPRCGRPRRDGRHVRQHTGAAEPLRSRRHLLGVARRGPRRRPRCVPQRRPAVRAPRGCAGTGAFHRALAVVPGDARVPQQRAATTGAAGPDGHRRRHRHRFHQLRSATHSHRGVHRVR